MRYLAITLLLIPAPAFAASAFADAYHDHQQWISPAYSYCLIFGLLILFAMFIITSICRTKTQETVGAISSYLIHHRIIAIIVTGVLLAIPLGIMVSVSEEIARFLSDLPGFALTLAFPISLVNKTFREKYLLSPFLLKWSIMISISAITALFLFIVLTDWNMLPSTDITCFNHPDPLHPEYCNITHPYDSLTITWTITFVFIVEIPIAIFLYWLGIIKSLT